MNDPEQGKDFRNGSSGSNQLVQPEVPALQDSTDCFAHSWTNVILTFLPQECQEESLRGICRSFGEIVSCRIVRDKTTGFSQGYGFVEYRSHESAKNAVKNLNGMRLFSKTIKVSQARPRSEAIRNANLYVSGLPTTWGEGDLVKWFAKYGKVISARILKDPISKQNKGVGFVRFDTFVEAECARQQENNAEIDEHHVLRVNFTYRSGYWKKENDGTGQQEFEDSCPRSSFCSSSEPSASDSGYHYQPFPYIRASSGSVGTDLVPYSGSGEVGSGYPVPFVVCNYCSAPNPYLSGMHAGSHHFSQNIVPDYNVAPNAFATGHYVPLEPPPVVDNSCELYIGNLDEAVTEVDVRELLRRYAEVAGVQVHRRKKINEGDPRYDNYGPKYAFVRLWDFCQADQTISALHRMEWMGRKIVVRPKSPWNQPSQFRIR